MSTRQQTGQVGAGVPVVVGVAAFTRRFRLAVNLAVAGFGCYLPAILVKNLVHRGRPSQYLPDVNFHGPAATGLGYISGHAAVAVALASVASPYRGWGAAFVKFIPRERRDLDLAYRAWRQLTRRAASDPGRFGSPSEQVEREAYMLLPAGAVGVRVPPGGWTTSCWAGCGGGSACSTLTASPTTTQTRPCGTTCAGWQPRAGRHPAGPRRPTVSGPGPPQQKSSNRGLMATDQTIAGTVHALGSDSLSRAPLPSGRRQSMVIIYGGATARRLEGNDERQPDA